MTSGAEVLLILSKKAVVHDSLTRLVDADVADTRIENCKPGTKRMLSLAVALLGSSPVLMLDEPSSGNFPSQSVVCRLTACLGAVTRDQITLSVADE